MTMINKNDDQKMKLSSPKEPCYAMAFPQQNTSSSSSSTLTTTQDEEAKATNSNEPTESNKSIMINSKRKNSNNNNDNKNNKKRRTVQKMSSIIEQDGPNIISAMIDHVKNAFKSYNNGAISDAKIIIERKLNATDIDRDQGRLAIPNGKILTEFLTNEEAQYLTEKVNDINMTTMDVKVIIGSSNYDMSLSRWNYNSRDGFKYVLKNKKGRWTKIKDDHSLDVNDTILVATFRYNNVLHFAIHKKRSTVLFGKKIEQYRM